MVQYMRRNAERQANMFVVSASTPAQLFHALRRQMNRPFLKCAELPQRMRTPVNSELRQHATAAPVKVGPCASPVSCLRFSMRVTGRWCC